MANEKKKENMEAVQSGEVKQQETGEVNSSENAAAPEKIEGTDVITEFEVYRKSFTIKEGEKDEKECYDYLIDVQFPYGAGVKKMPVHFVPADVGGYEVLDLVFNIPESMVQFVLRPWTIKADKKRGIEAATGMTYLIRASALPDLELKVKPAKDSDKAIMKCGLAMGGLS